MDVIKLDKACAKLNIELSTLVKICEAVKHPVTADPNSEIPIEVYLLIERALHENEEQSKQSRDEEELVVPEYVCKQCGRVLKDTIAEHYCKKHYSIYEHNRKDIIENPLDYATTLSELYEKSHVSFFEKILHLPEIIRDAIIEQRIKHEKRVRERLEREQAEKERIEQERLERERKAKEQHNAADKLLTDFLEKNPYIAVSDWEYLKSKIKEICPSYRLSDSIVEKQNSTFKVQQKIEHKEYFDNLLAYPLDEQQRDAIVTLGENVLVIAAAGSGKTSTIVAKTHYLVNKMQVDPRRILVVTYTRKAAEELQTRVGVAGVECCTFHKHAIGTIASITGNRPDPCESSHILYTVFDSLIRHNSTIESAFFLFQTVRKNLLQYDYNYKTYKEYLEALREYGKMAPYRDMDNNLCFVKSRQEMEIMVILTELGLDVRYEEKYPHLTSSTRYRQYRPDFTIHYNQDGQEKVIYLEHFGIDEHGNVPVWFGDGKQGGWAKANREYNDGIRWKREVHAQNGTTLIYTTSADFERGIISARDRIVELLEKYNVPITQLSIEQKKQKLAVPLSQSIESTIKLVSGFIALLKANGRTIDEIIDSISSNDIHKSRNTFLLKRLVKPLYERYHDFLAQNKECDFTDCLLKASRLLGEKQIYNYDYILVDEFQDMSMDKYNYLSALRRKNPRTRIFCVGDDWQSIYRFSGSDISLFSQFEQFNGATEELRIEATHRFGEPLLQRSSEFILENPAQKKKLLKADKGRETFLAFAGYDDELGERAIIEKQVARLPKEASIYIVSRYRYDIGKVFPEVSDVVKSENGGAVELTIAGRKVQALTAHSSKGLEADYVFLINCNSGFDDYGFPSQVSDDPILDYVLSRSDSYDHAEERRVFYVAITRAKRASYVLFDKKYPSLFVNELGGNVQSKDVKCNVVCPRCGTGSLKYTKDGYAKNGHFYTVRSCTNGECDLQGETIFFNSEKHPYEIVPYHKFLRDRKVTNEESMRVNIGNSPEFSFPVMLVPCAAEKHKVLSIAIDPKYDKYDLKKFYKYHLQRNDLAVCIQNNDEIERLLLTILKN